MVGHRFTAWHEWWRGKWAGVARRYKRRTNRVPQDERTFVIRADEPEYYDTDKLVDVFMLHLLARGLEAKLEPDKIAMLHRQLPIRASRL